MSSPKMTRMLGFFPPAACASVVPMPPTRRLETASAPSASFRTPASKSIPIPLSNNHGQLSRRRFAFPHSPVHSNGGCSGTVSSYRGLRVPLHSESRKVLRRSSTLNALQDVLHVGIDVLPELLQAATQVVQPRFTIARTNQPVLRTLPVAGKPVFALAALARQSIALGETKLLLLLGKHHSRDVFL